MSKRTELIVAIIGTIGCLAGIFMPLSPGLATDFILGYPMQDVLRWSLIIGCGSLAVSYWLLLFIELFVGKED